VEQNNSSEAAGQDQKRISAENPSTGEPAPVEADTSKPSQHARQDIP